MPAALSAATWPRSCWPTTGLTYGLARRPNTAIAGLQPVAADLLDVASLETALADVAPTHVFITSWMRNDTEAENIRVNGAMVRNLLAVLGPQALGAARGPGHRPEALPGAV